MELSALAVISLLRSDISICNPELFEGWGGRARWSLSWSLSCCRDNVLWREAWGFCKQATCFEHGPARMGVWVGLCLDRVVAVFLGDEFEGEMISKL